MVVSFHYQVMYINGMSHFLSYLCCRRWWMSDNDEMYSVICCVVSTTTGLVCLVLSCVAEMKAEMKAWKSIVPLIVGKNSFKYPYEAGSSLMYV